MRSESTGTPSSCPRVRPANVLSGQQGRVDACREIVRPFCGLRAALPGSDRSAARCRRRSRVRAAVHERRLVLADQRTPPSRKSICPRPACPAARNEIRRAHVCFGQHIVADDGFALRFEQVQRAGSPAAVEHAALAHVNTLIAEHSLSSGSTSSPPRSTTLYREPTGASRRRRDVEIAARAAIKAVRDGDDVGQMRRSLFVDERGARQERRDRLVRNRLDSRFSRAARANARRQPVDAADARARVGDERTALGTVTAGRPSPR